MEVILEAYGKYLCFDRRKMEVEMERFGRKTRKGRSNT